MHDGGFLGRGVRLLSDVHADGHRHGKVQHHQAAQERQPQVRADHDQNCPGVGLIVSLLTVFVKFEPLIIALINLDID